MATNKTQGESDSSYKIWIHRVNDTYSYFFETPEGNRPFILNYIFSKLDDQLFIESTRKEEIKESGFPFLIMIHSAEEILRGQIVKNEINVLGQKKLKDSEHSGNLKLPIVHISLSDIFVDSLYGIVPLHRDVPRFYMIMDNSIWNYLLPVSDTYYIYDMFRYKENRAEGKTTYTLEENFKNVLQSICRNYEKGLYYLKVAKEYADLNARLVCEDYLSGAHASGVSPFIFHSECVTRQMIMREFRGSEDEQYCDCDNSKRYNNDSVIDRILKRKWRILLLDDKADTPMETGMDNRGNNLPNGWNTKCRIIENILKKQLDLEGKICCMPCEEEFGVNKNFSNADKDNVIVIEYAQCLEVAKKALKNRQYDLLLLDYLLNETGGEIHYGYELLEDICGDQGENKRNYGGYKYIKEDKHHRLYCMFISAYSSAVNDRLLAEGLNQSEKYWFINIGACPTNTPQLFLYNLLKLMDKHLDDCGIPDIATRKIIEVMDNIFNPENHNVRENSAILYHKVLELQHHYRGLLSATTDYNGDNPFKTTGSVLMSHFVHKNGNLGGLLEHMSQLVHLAAFGTIRQWPEMWEEYIYFRSQLDEQCRRDNSEKTLNEKKQKLYDKIEEHIVNLKKADI